jgi:prepilin-type N-terminal cleavage/methylation domain-containing protein
MKNITHQKGFTVLEVIVALLLFSLLMGSLWQFYGEAYRGYISFDQQADLSEQARLVTSFIREEIRLSDQVTLLIETDTDGTKESKEIHPPVVPKTDNSSALREGELKRIKLNTLSSSRKTSRELWLKDNAPDTKEKGQYSLYYTANGTDSLISDKVDNIKVTRVKDASTAQFECTFAIRRDTAIIQEMQNTFSESLEYKTKWGTPESLGH